MCPINGYYWLLSQESESATNVDLQATTIVSQKTKKTTATVTVEAESLDCERANAEQSVSSPCLLGNSDHTTVAILSQSPLVLMDGLSSTQNDDLSELCLSSKPVT